MLSAKTVAMVTNKAAVARTEAKMILRMGAPPKMSRIGTGTCARYNSQLTDRQAARRSLNVGPSIQIMERFGKPERLRDDRRAEITLNFLPRFAEGNR